MSTFCRGFCFVLCVCAVYLTGILASLWISSTHHAVSEPSWVGVLAVVVRHDRHLHTLKVKWIEDCSAIGKVTLAHFIKRNHPV